MPPKCRECAENFLGALYWENIIGLAGKPARKLLLLWNSLSQTRQHQDSFISRQESNPKLYMKQQISPNTSSPSSSSSETSIVHFKEICLEVVRETCKILFVEWGGKKKWKRRRTECYDEIQGVLSPKCNKDSTGFIVFVVVASRHCQPRECPPTKPPTAYAPTV